MYKNQKIYFPTAGANMNNIPNKVIDKSIKKIIKDRKPQKVIKIKKDKPKPKKTKGIKELEKEKLMKLYGKNNNMISLLIFLLKRKDEKKDKKTYKRKSTYGRGGYKKANQYQTKTQLDKERKAESKKEENLKKNNTTFKSVDKLIQKAQAPLTTQTEREKLIQEAEKIAKARITELDYQKYSGYIGGEEEEKTARAILSIKEAVEKEGSKNQTEKIRLLKEAQNKGRKLKQDEKEKRYIDYIAKFIFTEKLTEDKIKGEIFQDFKDQNPDIIKPSKVGFLNLFKIDYKKFLEDFDIKGQEQILKEGKEKDRLEKVNSFIRIQNYSEKPSKNQLNQLIADFETNYPMFKKPTKKEFKSIYAEIEKEQEDVESVSSNDSDDIDRLLSKNYKTIENVDSNIDKFKELLTQKEVKQHKELNKEKNQKLEKQITEGYEDLNNIIKRGEVLRAISKRYPIEEIKDLPDFTDFSIENKDYETEILTGIANLTGYDFTELNEYKDSDKSVSSKESEIVLRTDEEKEADRVRLVFLDSILDKKDSETT